MTSRTVEPIGSRSISPERWEGLVESTEGVQLVTGGPGTGKTELLARRAAHLINTGKASSDQVLALSFSRDTAADLRGRITSGVRRSFGELPVGTFYAFARSVVEENCSQLFGTTRPPVLLTAPEQIHLVMAALADEDPGDWPLFYRRMLATRTLAEELADFMMRCGEQRITPGDLEKLAESKPAWTALPGFYRRYLSRLEFDGRIDYTGLLLRTNRALGMPRIMDGVAARFPYVLVDEYQEATLVQVEILKKLVRAGCHVTVVADPQQTSFSFRGAERASVIAFPAAFGNLGGAPPEVYDLRISHRVPEEILECAGALFPAPPPTMPDPAPHPGRVEVYVFDQEMEENDWIASEIKRMHLIDQVPYSQIAALTRTGLPIPGLSRALDREQVPHHRPGVRLIDHPAVRLVLDLARAAAADSQPEPSPAIRNELDRIMEGVLLGPLFSLTSGRAREMRLRRGKRQWSELLGAEGLGGSALGRLLCNPSWARQAPATEGFWKLWTKVPQFRIMAESQPEDFRHALFSFAQTLGRLAERSPDTSLLQYRELTLEGDIEASPLLSTGGSEEDRMMLGTVHQAKGRQFRVVFIFGAADGAFPDTRPFRSLLEGQLLSRPNMDYETLRQIRLREETSLAYIAMTRAGQRVVWTATTPDLNETRHNVSRFLTRLADHQGVRPAGPGPHPVNPPVGPLETEGYLRRVQRDVEEPPSRRLAAAAALAHPIRSGLWDAHGFAGVRSPGSDLGLVDPGHVMSASQAESYHRCPRRYALEKRLRINPPDESPYQKFGLVIHRVLQRCGEASRQPGKPGLDLSSALEELDKQIAEADFGTPVLNLAWRERGAKLLGMLSERWQDDGAAPIEFEMDVQPEMGGVPWRGRIDRVDRMADGTLRVVDYKTSKSLMTIKDAQESLQLGFYLWALSRDRPGDRAAAAEFWHPLKEGGSWTRSFDPARLGEVQQRLAEIASAIVEEKSDPRPWPTNPSRHCGRCEVRSLCPAWPEGKDAFLT